MANLFNKGDALPLTLDFSVNDGETTRSLYEFVQQAGVTEIEFTLGSNTYTLSAGTITLDEDEYKIFVSQEQSFALNVLTNYQIRLKVGDTIVCSSDIMTVSIGGVLSGVEL